MHQPMSTGDERQSSSVTGLNIRKGFATRKVSSQSLTHKVSSQSLNTNSDIGPVKPPRPDPRTMRIPSSTAIPATRRYAPEPTPPPEESLAPPEYSSRLTPVSTASSYSAHSPAGPSGDYFQRSAIAKKKPPPPPPKRIGSSNPGVFAVALYEYQGQNKGDLSFKEGDQIKVLKKTESTEDWWEGELRGEKGSFPANYCKLS